MAASRQFPASYQRSRKAFLEDLKRVQIRWPGARLESRTVPAEGGLAIEWIAADPAGSPWRALVVVCGVHGVESFVGSRMRGLLVDEFLDRLDPETTALTLVHTANPWGMVHGRRVTRNNVDLNRNFALERDDFQSEINPEYRLFDHFLNPDRPLWPLWLEIPEVVVSVLATLLRAGVKRFRNAVLQGQRVNPQGLYFTGKGYEPETRIVMDLVKEIFSKVEDVLLLDMHTGYGPKYQMSIVNSPQEGRTSAQLREDFHYPLVQKADPEQFYSMQGDMVDWLYKYRKLTGLEGKFYGGTFEFGTIGDTIPHEFISLWNGIFENQVYWKGAVSEPIRTKAQENFREMYVPSEEKWRQKALADCRDGLHGVLKAEGYI